MAPDAAIVDLQTGMTMPDEATLAGRIARRVVASARRPCTLTPAEEAAADAALRAALDGLYPRPPKGGPGRPYPNPSSTALLRNSA